ncbi:MAG: ATP-binding protein, partial [Bacteroidota bacterium]
MKNLEKKIAELKKKLNEEIQKEDSDNSLIISLSHELASLDQNQVRFSIDAQIIDRLGRELVAKQETAVSELVKNAYDADSPEVELIFENAWDPGGTLYIKDWGNGMNRDELINGFMRLSSSIKVHNPMSPKFNRTRAGKKGIGRFATQRLGEKLTIITQKRKSKTALKLSINWNDFEMDRDLVSISNTIES